VSSVPAQSRKEVCMSQQVCMRRLGTLACVDDNLYAFLRHGSSASKNPTRARYCSFVGTQEGSRQPVGAQRLVVRGEQSSMTLGSVHGWVWFRFTRAAFRGRSSSPTADVDFHAIQATSRHSHTALSTIVS